jgi:hypothetical protein
MHVFASRKFHVGSHNLRSFMLKLSNRVIPGLLPKVWSNRTESEKATRKRIVHESIQMETSAQEFSGRRHHAFVQMDISYRDEDPPSILSMDLRVLK